MREVETLLSRMQHQINSWEKAGDNRTVFLRCYTMMSTNMHHAVLDGRFSDANWVSCLLVRFSEYYFEALDSYNQFSENAPAVWKQAHDCAYQQQLHVLQNLLLGVNAHINYDLPLALYDCLSEDWDTYDEATKSSRKRDHELVNIIIGETIDAVQNEVISPLSPFMAFMDKFMGRMDEWLLSRLITKWRANVWQVTQNLIAAKTDRDRESIRVMQEVKVMTLGTQILKVI